MSNKKEKITLIAYSITKVSNKTYWNRVGVAFVNKDNSLNVKLNSIPLNGEFQLRHPKEVHEATK